MSYWKINRTNGNFKIMAATGITILALLSAVFYSINLLFLNNNNEVKYNSLLYAQVINNAMPIVRVVSFEDEIMAEEKITVQGELLKLMGINIYNPLSILGKEISLFSNYDFGAEEPGGELAFNELSEKKEQAGNFNIDDFELPNEQVDTKKNGSQGEPNIQNPSDISAENKTVKVYNPNIKKALDNSKPEILIYHTHTTESFSPNGNYFEDPVKNICDIGDALSNELENNYGIGVIHDKTIHNSVFNNSYYRSGETVDRYLKKYGDFKLIIDMHRDAGYSRDSFTTKMNGENVAKIAFVLTKKNPHYDKNAKVVNDLIEIGNNIFPGILRDTYYYNYGTKYFNQNKSNNAVLIEVGANINTHGEAKNSAKYMARIIAEYLNSKK